MTKLEAELKKTRSQRDQFRELADRTKSEVDSWTKWVNKVQPRFMAALRDRGIAQKERDKALKGQQNLTTTLQSTQAELASTNGKLTELRQKLSEAQEAMLNGNNPDLAKLTRMEMELEEGRAKVLEAEKRNELAQKDREYASNEYLNASHRAVELKQENDALQQQVVVLSRKANDNIVKINQIQHHNEVRELVRLLEEQKAIVKDRENELNRAREQLASLKNGRRETRQSSVPRSPRLGVSSPRAPGRRATTEVASGAASRGASPAPLGTFEAGGNTIPSGIGSLFAGQQQGNGRYAHLRD
jgi:chromosome segregation ATPase